MLDFFISPSYAQTTGSETNPMYQLAIFGGLFLLMYLLLIRPQRKKQKEHQQLVNSINIGDEIVLTSGMLGKVTQLDDHYFTLKVGKGGNKKAASDSDKKTAKDNDKTIELQFQRQAVHAVLPKGTIKGIS